MDYKAMWEELRTKIEAELAYYEDGRMCSMSEMIHGLSKCEAMLKDMKALEEKYGTYKIVEQECGGCGKHFHLKYCSDGNYEYIDEVCDCLATFHPVDGEPSFSEWMEHIKE